jgi:hypothetical protein
VKFGFCTSINRAALYCETSTHSYWIWLHLDGSVSREVDCKPVSEFPKDARKAHQMEVLFERLQSQLLEHVKFGRLSQFWSLKRQIESAR